MKRNRLKFAGSLALGLSTAGVLLAAGGQLNFLGNERPTHTPVRVKKVDTEKVKYTFYNDLKNRKARADETARSQSSTSAKTNSQSAEKYYRYVVQVGAFSKAVDANRQKARAAQLGYPTRVVKASKYLVQVGPVTGKDKAYAVERQLKAKHFPTLVKRLK